MSAILKQTKGGANTTTTSCAVTWDGNTTSGNLILVVVSCGNVTISSVTDSQSNTYTAIDNTTVTNFGTQRGALYYAKNITGGTTPTVTVTYGGNISSNVIIREYSGLDTTSPLDKNVVATGSNTVPASGSTATTTQNAELVVGWVATGTSGIPTVGSGYGDLTTQGSGTVTAGIEDKDQTSTQTQSASFGGTFFLWICGVATFKEASSPTTTSTSSSTSTTSTSTSSTSTSISTSSTSTSMSTSSTSTSVSTSTTVSTSTSSTSTSLSTSTSISTSSTSTSTSTTVSYTTSTSSTSTSQSTSTTTSQSTSTSSTSSSTSTSISTSTTTSQSTSTSSTSSSTSSTTSQSTSTTQSWTTSTSSTSTSSTSSSISTSTTTTLPHDPKVTPSIDVFEDNPRMQHIIDKTMAEIRPDQIRLDSAPNKSVVTVKSDKPRMQSKTTLSYSAVRKDTARLGHIRKNVMVRIRKK